MCKVEICNGFRIEYGDGIKTKEGKKICRVPVIENGEYGHLYFETIPSARNYIYNFTTEELVNCKPGWLLKMECLYRYSIF